MKINNSAGSSLALCMGIALSLSLAALAHEPKPTTAEKTMNNEASMQLHHIMMMPSKKMDMPVSGDVDKDFAVMMTMHHQQAIDMADVLIAHGRNPELKAMAQKMKTAQQAEIQQMARYTK